MAYQDWSTQIDPIFEPEGEEIRFKIGLSKDNYELRTKVDDYTLFNNTLDFTHWYQNDDVGTWNARLFATDYHVGIKRELHTVYCEWTITVTENRPPEDFTIEGVS